MLNSFMYKKECKWCKCEIIVDNHYQFGAHVTNCDMNIDRKLKIEQKKETSKKLYYFNCKKCSNQYELELKKVQIDNGKYRKYCSRSCANSRIVTDEHKLKTCMTMMKNDYCDVFFIRCKNCDKVTTSKIEKDFCNQKCLANYRVDLLKIWGNKGGLKSVESQSEKRRSKNEIYFSELCINYFNNVECNKSIFNGWDSDVIIHDIKYAILWNGKWHYDKIKLGHSVSQVQNRDMIKIKEISNFGYVPYIIKDMGKYNMKFVEEQFSIFIRSLENNI
jgi:hypothetical protein